MVYGIRSRNELINYYVRETFGSRMRPFQCSNGFIAASPIKNYIVNSLCNIVVKMHLVVPSFRYARRLSQSMARYFALVTIAILLKLFVPRNYRRTYLTLDSPGAAEPCPEWHAASHGLSIA